MRKIINEPVDFVDEVLAGIVAAHPSDYRFGSSDRRTVVANNAPVAGKVGIVTGGGSGHLPLFLGYVGRGLATGVAVGNVFSSPSPDQIFEATRAVDGGAGVLYLYGNYGGDVYNFDLAAERAATTGIRTTTVLGHDDILSAPTEAAATRRGVAGLVFAYKVAGAAAERGDDLDTVTRLARKVSDATRTAGVGLAPTILPAAGRPTFELGDGEMEIGVGIHGESGVATVPIAPARDIADDLFARMRNEVGIEPGARLAVLVNGLGATPLEELYLLYGRIAELTADADAEIAWNFIGEYATSLEMAGASISLLRLDDELEALLAAPASSPFWKPGSAVVSVAATARGDDAAPTPAAEIATTTFESPIRAAVLELARTLPPYTEELRDLDAALGDGDLGITVSTGVAAMAERVNALPKNGVSSALLREIAMAFASANPSTFAALIGSGLLSASTIVDDSRSLDRVAAIAIGRKIADAISLRGGAQLGDKTLLDVLVPALDELEKDPDSSEFHEFLTRRIEDVAALRSARGRAAWHQDRSIGLKDPGSVATAYALMSLVSASRSEGV
ncbi:PTS-dependent dihydroxyacetone kinase, dihydroxyacetone-binding subunit DhaK [Arthrobacter sp. Hiyo6]|nr:PTS-dependent dihydroxyacetone kinase, dihydroxyacetone-binding subunit DhaK [Arthrobacter sp. Hiyo6]